MPHVKVLGALAPAVLLLARRRRAPVVTEANVGVDGASPPVRKPKRRPLAQPPVMFGWWLILTLVSYAIALSYSTIPFYRYAVPLTVMLYALAALSAAWIARALATGFVHHALLTLIALAIVTLPQLWRTEDYLNQFAHDSRDELREWVNTELTGTPLILADGYTDLRPASFLGGRGRPQIVRDTYAAQAGSIERVRSSGFQYVIIASSSFERFTDERTMGMPGAEREFVRYARFYRTLFEKYPIVKQWKAEHPMWSFTNPDIYVFKISDAGRPPPPRPSGPRRRS
jgi:hypothetical protein